MLLEESSNKNIVGIIPARLGSEEIHAKVLLDLGGKTVIQHVYEKASAAGLFDEIVIAADHKSIIDVAKGFGANTFLTQQEHICGSDRCAEAVRALMPNVDIVVNIQADEPFLNPQMIPKVIEPLLADTSWDMATLCYPCQDEESKSAEFTVKIAKSAAGRALYFSRSVIPYPRYERDTAYFQHIGIYAYRRDQLLRFADFGPSELELAEGLEQLRALEAELRIKVIETDLEYARISIDTQEDIENARQYLQQLNEKGLS